MSVLNLETVELTRSERVAWVTMNRPDALNAWTRQLGQELLQAVDEAAADPEVRAIVLTGAGRAFSSGADLKAGHELGDDGKPDVLTPLREVYNPLILRVRTVPKPVVAAVNGPAVGIGCSLALAADLVVASRSAYFLLAFVNIGLGLDGGASQTLAARVGHARAFEIAYTGERIPAERALAWNMINEVVEDEQLGPRVTELTEKLAGGPPGSYASIKRTINHRAYAGFDELLDLEAVLQQERAASADFMEGVLAFMQKRPANFTGS
ncbi:MAG TPA: enoyl-CoA hydratase-related protein [Solirubrobacteraceae bacterium]|jgi:2-(1,2-epoxy-1,2-dihydrophenyl)acetyl-CoA isomerase